MLSDIEDILADPIGQKKKKPKKPLPEPIDPEEERSLLSDLGGGLMSGLGFVGNQLDKFTGSRALRGVLGGHPRELASIVPFSDTLGLTRREDIVHGTDLIGAPKDTPLFSPEGALGFGLEVALDPTLPFTGLFKGAATGAGKALKGAGLFEDAIRAGTREAALAGEKIGPRVAGLRQTAGKYLSGLGPAERAVAEAKIATFHKAPLSPELLDAPLAGNLGYGVPFMEHSGTIGKVGGVGEKIASVQDKIGDVMRWGEASTGARTGTKYSPGRHLAQLFDPTVMGAETEAGQRAAMDLYEKVPKVRAKAQYVMKQGLQELKKAGVLDDAIEDVWRQVEGIDPLRPEYEVPVTRAREAMERANKSAKAIGAGTPTALEDQIIKQYWPRYAQKEGGSISGKASKVLGAADPSQIGRSNPLKDIEGGTGMLEQMVKDPDIATLGPEYVKSMYGHELPFHDTKRIKNLTEQLPKMQEAKLLAGQENVFQHPLASAERHLISRGEATLKGQNTLKMLAEESKPASMAAETDVPIKSLLNLATEPNIGLRKGNFTEGAVVSLAKKLKKQGVPIRKPPATITEAVQRGYLTQKQGERSLELYHKRALAEFKRTGRALPPEAVATPHPQTLMEAVQQQHITPKQAVRVMNRWNRAGKPGGNPSWVFQQSLEDLATQRHALGMRILPKSYKEGIFKSWSKTVAPPTEKLDTLLGKGGLYPKSYHGLIFKRWASRVVDRVVPKEIAADATRFKALFEQPEEVHKIIRALDSGLGIFKAGVLTWPARYVRDLFSGQVNLSLAKMWSHKDFLDAKAITNGGKIDALSFPVVKKLLAKEGLSSTPENAMQLLRSHLSSMEIIGAKQAAMSEVGQHAGQAAETLEDMLRDIPGVKPVSLKTAAGELKGDWRKMGIKGSFGAKETTMPAVRAGNEIGTYTDSLNRLTGYLNQIRQGVDPFEARAKVMANQVDYSTRSFTPFERAYMKRVFPFYSFTRKMIPYVLDTLAEQPAGRLAQVIRGQARAVDENQPVPSHIAQTAAFPIPGAPEGSQRFLTSLGLMHEDPLSLFRPGQNLYKTTQGTLQELAGRLNPLVKAPLELAAGKQLYSGRELEDLEGNLGRTAANITGRKEPYETPLLLEQAISNSPLSRVATTARTLTDPRKGPLAKATNLLSGLRVQDVDKEKSRNIALREALEDRLRGKPGVRQLRPHLSVKEEDVANLSEDDKLMLQLYKSLAAQATKRAKQKKENP